MRSDLGTDQHHAGFMLLFAYIDPALGSMLLQAMAGVIFAALVMGRRILLAPLHWLHLRRPTQDPEASESAVDE